MLALFAAAAWALGTRLFRRTKIEAATLTLAHSLLPLATTLSVLLFPVVGVFSVALWLRELLHWQDYAAVLLMVVAAIASVLWPTKARAASAGSPGIRARPLPCGAVEMGSLVSGNGWAGTSQIREMPAAKDEARVDPHAEGSWSA